MEYLFEPSNSILFLFNDIFSSASFGSFGSLLWQFRIKWLLIWFYSCNLGQFFCSCLFVEAFEMHIMLLFLFFFYIFFFQFEMIATKKNTNAYIECLYIRRAFVLFTQTAIVLMKLNQTIDEVIHCVCIGQCTVFPNEIFVIAIKKLIHLCTMCATYLNVQVGMFAKWKEWVCIL